MLNVVGGAAVIARAVVEVPHVLVGEFREMDRLQAIYDLLHDRIIDK